jgi:two-component system, NarL family, response regulator LiaR
VKTRVLVADDHATMLEWLAAKIREECEVVAVLQDSTTIAGEVQRLNPDVVVLDFAMTPINGLEAIRLLRQAGATAGVVLVTGYEDEQIANAAIRAGASEFVPKSRLADDLLPAIRKAGQKPR